MYPQYGELWPSSGWDRFVSLGHPCKFQRVSRLCSITARHLVVGVSQTLRRWTEGATYIRHGGHHVGHWPIFLVWYISETVNTNKMCSCADSPSVYLIVVRSIGAIGVVLFFVWLVLAYEKPSQHPWISQEECKMIESKQGEAAIIYEVNMPIHPVSSGT